EEMVEELPDAEVLNGAKHTLELLPDEKDAVDDTM
ncbi:hypothetical protein PF010_g28442, partial [Phytophthora fragariae]